MRIFFSATRLSIDSGGASARCVDLLQLPATAGIAAAATNAKAIAAMMGFLMVSSSLCRSALAAFVLPRKRGSTGGRKRIQASFTMTGSFCSSRCGLPWKSIQCPERAALVRR